MKREFLSGGWYEPRSDETLQICRFRRRKKGESFDEPRVLCQEIGVDGVVTRPYNMPVSIGQFHPMTSSQVDLSNDSNVQLLFWQENSDYVRMGGT